MPLFLIETRYVARYDSRCAAFDRFDLVDPKSVEVSNPTIVVGNLKIQRGCRSVQGQTHVGYYPTKPVREFFFLIGCDPFELVQFACKDLRSRKISINLLAGKAKGAVFILDPVDFH